MPPKKRTRALQRGDGLVKRGDSWYWRKRHPRLPDGRVYLSLRTGDEETAMDYAGALRTLMQRGDWSTIRRWAKRELAISDVSRLVREGEWDSLKRLHTAGLKLGEQVKDYLERVLATRRRRTHTVRESSLRLARAHFGDEFPMHTLTTAGAEAYLHAKRGDGDAAAPWSPNTQASHRTTLAAFWKWAMEREHEAAEQAEASPTLLTNPWRRAETKKRGQTRFTFFTAEQARALLHHRNVSGLPVAALLAVAFYAGLRAGELANLRTGIDVDFEGGFIHVQSRGGAHPWEPKTKHSSRKVAIIPALLPYLRHHERFAGRYFFHGEGRDAPPSHRTLAGWTSEAFTAAGFKYGRSGDALSLHSCRHSFVTWLIAAGVPITTVAKLAGDSVEIILSTYAHHMPNQEPLAYQRLQEFAGGEA